MFTLGLAAFCAVVRLRDLADNKALSGEVPAVIQGASVRAVLKRRLSKTFPRSVDERDSYDAWGKRRSFTGTDNPTCTLTSQTTRGWPRSCSSLSGAWSRPSRRIATSTARSEIAKRISVGCPDRPRSLQAGTDHRRKRRPLFLCASPRIARPRSLGNPLADSTVRFYPPTPERVDAMRPSVAL